MSVAWELEGLESEIRGDIVHHIRIRADFDGSDVDERVARLIAALRETGCDIEVALVVDARSRVGLPAEWLELHVAPALRE